MSSLPPAHGTERFRVPFSVSGHTLNSILATWGYIAVFAFVAVDAAGIPFPGETMLLAAAIYAGSGHMSIIAVIAVAAIGATAGFVVSYTIGRTGGRTLAYRYGERVHVKKEHLERAEVFFQKYGDITVFLGRFVSVGRAFAALLAGINDMSVVKFMVFNLAGAIAWSVLFGVLGFELGHNLPLLHKVTRVVEIGAIVLVVLAVLGFIGWRFRDRLHIGAGKPG
ncbi:MAG TPA: DedA family protein [Chloroflexota bacterium]|nr:DedA family protein [Chloroflexota bacterium]